MSKRHKMHDYQRYDWDYLHPAMVYKQCYSEEEIGAICDMFGVVGRDKFAGELEAIEQEFRLTYDRHRNSPPPSKILDRLKSARRPIIHLQNLCNKIRRPLTYEECQPLYSVLGMLRHHEGVVCSPPFRIMLHLTGNEYLEGIDGVDDMHDLLHNLPKKLCEDGSRKAALASLLCSVENACTKIECAMQEERKEANNKGYRKKSGQHESVARHMFLLKMSSLYDEHIRVGLPEENHEIVFSYCRAHFFSMCLRPFGIGETEGQIRKWLERAENSEQKENMKRNKSTWAKGSKAESLKAGKAPLQETTL